MVTSTYRNVIRNKMGLDAKTEKKQSLRDTREKKTTSSMDGKEWEKTKEILRLAFMEKLRQAENEKKVARADQSFSVAIPAASIPF